MMYELKPTAMVFAGAIALAVSGNSLTTLAGTLLTVAGVMVYHMRINQRKQQH
jgi:hypothetical protein